MTINWTDTLLEQLTWHWDHHLRPKLGGLTDDEYLWEPAPGCWSLRPRNEATTPWAAGGGDLVLDFDFPEPVPAPVTTIAWRLSHLIVGIFGARNAAHFGDTPVDYPTAYQTAIYPGDAAEALATLDEGYTTWVRGVSGFDADRLAAPVGEAEGEFAERPYADLILHINREVIHHGAEILLLRDLYRHQP